MPKHVTRAGWECMFTCHASHTALIVNVVTSIAIDICLSITMPSSAASVQSAVLHCLPSRAPNSTHWLGFETTTVIDVHMLAAC